MAKISYNKMQQSLRIQTYKEFINYDKVVDFGIEKMWKDLCESVPDSDIDPVDFFAEEVESFNNTRYSMKLMNICCLSETWEQDLYNYLKEKGLISTNSNDYNNTKNKFEEAYPSCPISNYPQILEMRALVNAIKHGEGNSFTRLRRMTSDEILADSNWGVVDESGTTSRIKQIDFDANTLTSKTLKVDGKLELYIKAIIGFWEDVYALESESIETSSV